VPRTPLARQLVAVARRLRAAEAAGLPPRAALELNDEELAARAAAQRGLTRREALAAAAAAGVLLAMPRAASAKSKQPGTVVVVGGGLAGLVAAWRLKQHGITANVYEASTYAGGRVRTNYDSFAENQRVERGGELIDSGHMHYRTLIKQLGFTLDNLVKAEPKGSEDFASFDGASYSEAQVAADFAGVFDALKADVKAAPFPTTYNSFTPAAQALDAMSVSDWIATRVPGGLASKFGQILDVAYTIEYGADSGVQSALNLIYLLGFGSTPKHFSMFGESDEVARVHGGNGQVPAKLRELLGEQVQFEHRLAAAATLGDGRTRLSFDAPGGTVEVVADRVVMAVPFSVLRASVDIGALAVKPLKATAIAQIGMGTNSKLHVQFTSRLWETLGCNGATVADLGYQNTWEETRAQAGAAGILVDFTGGTVGAGFGSDTPENYAAAFLAQIEPLLPGLTAKWNGLATVDFWTGSPFQLGSYSYWKVGQYTGFSGVESEVEGTVHFAGEHTSLEAQGYMEGAVESGERAAKEVLAAL
jgi:monoamine oxidase